MLAQRSYLCCGYVVHSSFNVYSKICSQRLKMGRFPKKWEDFHKAQDFQILLKKEKIHCTGFLVSRTQLSVLGSSCPSNRGVWTQRCLPSLPRDLPSMFHCVCHCLAL